MPAADKKIHESTKKIRNQRYELKKARFQRVLDHIKSGKTKIRSHERELIITPQMLGVTFEVYTGKAWETVQIIPEMLGHRLGEFAL
ncbi:30S ribosomal protein S19, partial [Enterococcus hirae]